LKAGGPGKPAWKYYFCTEDTSYPSLRGLRKTADVRPDHHLLALDEIYGYLRDCPARKKLLVLVTAPASGDEPVKYPPPLCRVLPKLPPPPEGVAGLTSCAEGEFSSARLDFLIALRRFVVERAEDGGRGAKPGDEEANMDGLLAHVRAGVQGKLKEYGPLPFRQNPQLLGK